MRSNRPFLKQKLRLYFDENFPVEVIRYFASSSFWRKKLKIVSARGEKNLGQSDFFHYAHCTRKSYTLVTLDSGFNDDRRHPFASGQMAGIIIINVSSSDHPGILLALSHFLEFLLVLPFPKAFMFETKVVAGHDGVIMRGRDVLTREIKSLRVIAGETSLVEVRNFFNYW
jgi:hypothetical protein